MVGLGGTHQVLGPSKTHRLWWVLEGGPGGSWRGLGGRPGCAQWPATGQPGLPALLQLASLNKTRRQQLTPHGGAARDGCLRLPPH